MRDGITNINFHLSYMESMFDSLPGGIFVYRNDYTEEILYANHKALEIFGCDTTEEFMELTGGTFFGAVYPGDLERVEEEVRTQIANGSDQFDHVSYRIRTRQGDMRFIEDYGHLVVDPYEGELFYVFIVDTKRASLVTDVDHITEFPGKKSFLETADLRTFASDDQVDSYCVIFLNLINFKLYTLNNGMEQGEELLRLVGDILRNVFPEDLLSRFGEDHFGIFTLVDRLEEKLQEVHAQIAKIHNRTPIDCKMGICRLNRETGPVEACDLAKIACGTIHHSPEHFWVEYDPVMKKDLERYSYIVEHIDEAIEKGYIQVFYQPVVRTISGALCGMEALARWDDPGMGFLAPADFIPALEESLQIYKLDLYVVEQICKNYARCVQEDIPIVPVSFNLSRLDFERCDIFRSIEALVAKYDVPRDMMHVEITESILTQDDDKITDELNRFRNVGYQVWMDDFGSGYSSLNVLKEYNFDELKIDMAFLSQSTNKSQTIISSMVDMAKRIGIQTLAEGVEKQEQLDFLCSIGCEKVQGFFFGKPAPYDKSLQSCLYQGLSVEHRAWKRYYDTMGRTNFITDRPMMLMETCEGHTEILFMNPEFLEVIQGVGFENREKFADQLNSDTSPIGRKVRDFLRVPIASREEEHVIFPCGEHYLRMSVKTIAYNEKHYAHVVNMFDVTRNADSDEQNVRDRLLRNLYLLYDKIQILDADTDSSIPINYDVDTTEEEEVRHGYEKSLKDYAFDHVYPRDQKAFLRFMDLTTLARRMEEKHNNTISEYFRIRQEDGEYSWEVHTFLRLDLTDQEKYLFCTKVAAVDDPRIAVNLVQNYGFIGKETDDGAEIREEGLLDVTDGQLWHNLMFNGHVNYFWKDTKRRFMGASKSFLDYYGIDDVEEIIGRTDEDMRWHIDNGPYQNDEVDVLTKGAHILDARGKCLIKGVVHNIVASKIPIYKDGKIIGLVGYFIDAERSAERKRTVNQIAVTDNITGIMNVRGLLENLLYYAQEYRIRHSDFAILLVNVPETLRCFATYGVETGNHILRMIGQTLEKIVKTTGTLGRLSTTDFAIIIKPHNVEEVVALCDKINQELRRSFVVDGKECTLFTQTKYVLRSESEDSLDMIRKLIGNKTDHTFQKIVPENKEETE